MSNFNSTLVRLKDTAGLITVETDAPYFNSTLVRLKERVADHLPLSLTFQFHIGTIKR